MSKTFYIIHHNHNNGSRQVVGVIHQTRHESAGVERAIAVAQTIARMAACDDACALVVEMDDPVRQGGRVFASRTEIAHVTADGPIPF